MGTRDLEPVRSIDRTPSRAVFAELIALALSKLGSQPSPMAVAYLIELLEARLRVPGAEAEPEPTTLAEALLLARSEGGTAQLGRLRALGDRALFVAGFFGESLSRSLVDLDYYGQIGRAAYRDLSGCLACVSDSTWCDLYLELAEDFLRFVDLLAEVGDGTRGDRSIDLLRLYERYVRTGSPRDRARLIVRGLVPLSPGTLRGWQ